MPMINASQARKFISVIQEVDIKKLLQAKSALEEMEKIAAGHLHIFEYELLTEIKKELLRRQESLQDRTAE